MRAALVVEVDVDLGRQWAHGHFEGAHPLLKLGGELVRGRPLVGEGTTPSDFG